MTRGAGLQVLRQRLERLEERTRPPTPPADLTIVTLPAPSDADADAWRAFGAEVDAALQSHDRVIVVGDYEERMRGRSRRLTIVRDDVEALMARLAMTRSRRGYGSMLDEVLREVLGNVVEPNPDPRAAMDDDDEPESDTASSGMANKEEAWAADRPRLIEPVEEPAGGRRWRDW